MTDRPNPATEWTPEMWALLASVLGFNELAKTQDTLGRKVYCRVCRDLAEGELRRLGGDIDVTRKPALVTLPRPPHVEFTDSDIELMRACVAEHDRRRAIDAHDEPGLGPQEFVPHG